MAQQISPVVGIIAMAATVLAAVSVYPQGPTLAGTTWRLVKFQGGDDTVRTPDDGSKYTLAFGTDGRVAVRIDCNRGNGAWKAAGSELSLGPLALTRALCPPNSMHDFFVKQWPFIRSYMIKDRHLFLSLMADGGIFEFEPAAETATIQGTATYRERMALPPSAVLEAVLEDVSRADAPARVIARSRVEQPGNPPIPFTITYDPSTIAAKGRYVVRVTIQADGRTLFRSDTATPVITGGRPTRVSMTLRRSTQ